MTKTVKAKLLNAYLDKTISRDELSFLIEKGISIPPIAWLEENSEEGIRRKLVARVLGVKFPEIEWIKSS